ncbi:prepilin-type N-terminal cleavage/methylation domain-containing protein [Marinobacter sp. ES-1]|uniref:type IV pilus modification PilV family protein n=1 Tax=Marinobacter sp. ES-1 TaxID=1396858 RepID=UPI0009DC2E40|nr:prepilin-type N-terminal cleavage/methylation domain-containing protein [Marinobacter sp. ES-1]
MCLPLKSPGCRNSQLGFTMIEVVVSLLILLIGLMGVISMQYLALKQINNTHLRSQVAFHAQSMADLIRANNSRPLGADDLQAWEQQLAHDIPSAKGEVVFNTGAAVSSAVISITWPERQLHNDVEEQTFTVTARLGE